MFKIDNTKHFEEKDDIVGTCIFRQLSQGQAKKITDYLKQELEKHRAQANRDSILE